MRSRVVRAIPLVALGVLVFACSVESSGLGEGDAGPDAGRDGSVGRDGTVVADGCTPLAELCNAADDDCDARIDEDFDLARDPANCGACGGACAAGMVCSGSSCATDCTAPEANCSGSCVTVGEHPAHCTGCGMPCPVWTNGAATCSGGMCSGTCNAGFDDCDGDPANGCEADLSVDGSCGGCGVTCALPNATATCSAGGCEVAACDAGYDDCDGASANGCEAMLGTTSHCGACGDACPSGESCFDGSCTSCAPGCDCDRRCTGSCTCSCAGTCSYDCPSDCTIACTGSTATCNVDAVDANANFTGDCSGGATCNFDARGASNVYGTCQGARTDCRFDCSDGPTEDTSNCDEIDCTGNARCAIYCGDLMPSKCDFRTCMGGSTRCGDWVTCGWMGTCPPP